jgi:hypothetical protein
VGISSAFPEAHGTRPRLYQSAIQRGTKWSSQPYFNAKSYCALRFFDIIAGRGSEAPPATTALDLYAKALTYAGFSSPAPLTGRACVRREPLRFPSLRVSFFYGRYCNAPLSYPPPGVGRGLPT